MTSEISVPRRLGRCPRAFDPSVPHLSALRAAPRRAMAPLPTAVHWGEDPKLNSWGMMLNDQLGCCTIAAAYHLMQVWSARGRSQVLTEPDDKVLEAYREFAGYNGTPATDNGAVEQDILCRWLTTGVPIREGTAKDPAPGRSRLLFYGEIDVRNVMDVCRAIYDCGGVYIGFNVPDWLMSEPTLPSVWDGAHPTRGVVGGHAVCLVGYDEDENTFDVVSWGQLYKMKFDFFGRYVDEAYALAHPWWIDAIGRTPLNLSVEELRAQMRGQLYARS